MRLKKNKLTTVSVLSFLLISTAFFSFNSLNTKAQESELKGCLRQWMVIDPTDGYETYHWNYGDGTVNWMGVDLASQHIVFRMAILNYGDEIANITLVVIEQLMGQILSKTKEVQPIAWKWDYDKSWSGLLFDSNGNTWDANDIDAVKNEEASAFPNRSVKYTIYIRYDGAVTHEVELVWSSAMEILTIGYNLSISDAASYRLLYFHNCTEEDYWRGGTVEDVGLMYSKEPNEFNFRRCGFVVGFFLKEPVLETIENIYVHVWWSYYKYIDFDDTVTFGYAKNAVLGFGFEESFETFTNCSREDVELNLGKYKTFHLEARLWNLERGITLSLDNFENFAFKIFTYHSPAVISSPNYSSFIILNLPSNDTLKELDSDMDGLSDFAELFIYFTNPFNPDTDGDGIDDGTEVMLGKNPLVSGDDYE